MPTRSLQNGENGPTRSNHLPVHLDKTKLFRKQPQYLCHPPTPTTPNNSSLAGYHCLHFSSAVLVEIARELTKIHPIKLEPSPTPPTIHLGHTSTVRKRLRRLHHPLTIPNDPSPPSYCPHFNVCGNCSRTRKDTSNQARALPHTSPKIHINQTSTFWKRLRRRRHPPSTPNNSSPSGYCPTL